MKKYFSSGYLSYNVIELTGVSKSHVVCDNGRVLTADVLMFCFASSVSLATAVSCLSAAATDAFRHRDSPKLNKYHT